MTFVAAAALAMLLLVMVANVLVDLYVRGAVRHALDEGARAGARSPEPVATCRARAEAVLDALVPGPVGDGVRVDCSVTAPPSPPGVTASARIELRRWLPGTGGPWRFDERAVATRVP